VTTPRPFPWHTLEPYPRADLDAWRRVKQWVETSLNLEPSLAALERAIGTRVELRLKDARRGPPMAPFVDGIALDIEATGVRESEVLLEVEGPLATALAARALKRPPPRLHALLSRKEAETIAGALAALVSAVGRTSPSSPLRVRAAGPSHDTRARTGGPSELRDTATFTVLLDDEAYLARVLIHTSGMGTGELVWNQDRLKLLGVTPIGLSIVAGAFVTTPSEIASLVEGDAWMLGNQPRLRSLRGEVYLAAPDAVRGVRAELVDNGRLVLRGGTAELCGSAMIPPEENDALVDAVGDVPLVVRIEVGTVRMTAREWAALLPGDVVEIARRVGDPVTLRVSGVEVARGELVEIEGEIGVRVLSRVGADRAR
jgi:flagellar motor switch/type III secretory pathway protein FliN